LSKELVVSQTSFSQWLRERGTLAVTGEHIEQRRAEDWTAGEKVTAVLDFEKLAEEQRGIFLREKGLHEATLVR
jgi:transposase